MIRHDSLSEIFTVMILIAGAISALLSIDVKALARKGEFYLVMIVSTMGACLMSGAADLIMVFLALETTTIPLYVLAAFNRRRSALVGKRHEVFPVRLVRFGAAALRLEPALRLQRRDQPLRDCDLPVVVRVRRPTPFRCWSPSR